MSIGYNFKRVLAKGLDNYNSPVRWNIANVEVMHQPEPTVTGGSAWKRVLEEWLPRFDEVGWLDTFNKIYIGDGIVEGDAVGQYNHNNTIDLETDPKIPWGTDLTINDNRESILIHEFIHHAHLSLNGYEGVHKQSSKKLQLESDVSYYAGTNIGEAIAETGVGIVQGKQFPDWVYDYYEEHDGPQEVYELSNG